MALRLGLGLLASLGFGSQAWALVAGADYLRVEIPARPTALGGAFGAFFDDPHAFLFNPAALGPAPRAAVAATHFMSIIDTSYNLAVLTQPFKFKALPGSAGLAVQQNSTANLIETDLNGTVVGAIDNYDLVLTAAYGGRLTSTLSSGLAIKAFNSHLAGLQARGAALDIGFISELNPRVSLGLAFQNLGVQEAYENQAAPLPSFLRIAARGVAWQSPETEILVAGEIDRPWTTSDPILLNVGAEYWQGKVFAFRAGYRLGAVLGQVSVGMGLRWEGLAFDYTYVAMGDLGASQRFTLGAELAPLFKKLKVLVPE